MVYKRYIKRDGKTFGPYYYESYRDSSGNIRSRYLKDYKPKKNYFLLTIILCSVIMFLGVFSYFSFFNNDFSEDFSFNSFGNFIEPLQTRLSFFSTGFSVENSSSDSGEDQIETEVEKDITIDEDIQEEIENENLEVFEENVSISPYEGIVLIKKDL
jgi:hypothetical protein